MQSIVTKFLPVTNTRGSRIKATCERGSIIVSYPHHVRGEACHRYAVDALTARFAAEDFKRDGTPPENNPWRRPYLTGSHGHLYMHTTLSRDLSLGLADLQQGRRDAGTMGRLSSGLDELKPR